MPHASKHRAKPTAHRAEPTVELTGRVIGLPDKRPKDVLLVLIQAGKRKTEHKELTSWHPSIEAATLAAFAHMGMWRYHIYHLDSDTYLKGQTYKGSLPSHIRTPKGKVSRIPGSDGNRGRIFYNLKGSLPIGTYTTTFMDEKTGEIMTIEKQGYMKVGRKLIRKKVTAGKQSLTVNDFKTLANCQLSDERDELEKELQTAKFGSERYKESQKKLGRKRTKITVRQGDKFTHEYVYPSRIDESRIIESMPDDLASLYSGSEILQNSINKAHMVNPAPHRAEPIEVPEVSDSEIPSHASTLHCANPLCNCMTSRTVE